MGSKMIRVAIIMLGAALGFAAGFMVATNGHDQLIPLIVGVVTAFCGGVAADWIADLWSGKRHR
ncbi:MAG TPA: hypothetical protein VGM05_01370 [Planctomycetaceae bacterium]|jgi:uncharacterized membrane protein YeaQ/YmgE (transglycosylase-associated protein family)